MYTQETLCLEARCRNVQSAPVKKMGENGWNLMCLFSVPEKNWPEIYEKANRKICVDMKIKKYNFDFL